MPRRLAGARRSQKKRDTDSLVDGVAEGTIFDSVMADNYRTPVKVRAICFPLDTASLKNALKDSMLMARLNNHRSTTFRKEVHCTLIVRESTAQYHALPGGRLPKQVGPSLQAAREQGHLR
jgi:hypothetical protein